MSENIQHHWHEPTQGQVTKATYQYLADMGVTKDAIQAMVEKHVERKMSDILASHVADRVNSGKFDSMLLAAVADYKKNLKEVFDRQGGYGVTNHIRDIIRQALAELILSEYKVEVTKK